MGQGSPLISGYSIDGSGLSESSDARAPATAHAEMPLGRAGAATRPEGGASPTLNL